jgi:hypothetical protein
MPAPCEVNKSTLLILIITVMVITSYLSSTITLLSSTPLIRDDTHCPKNNVTFITIKEPVKAVVEAPPPPTPAPAETPMNSNCTITEGMNPDKNARINYFYNVAKSFDPVTDKVTTHSYQTMYGTFLLPFYEAKPNMKFLEVGLGCDMGYGPGASVKLWKKLFPQAELWEAEFNEACVNKSRANGQLEGIHTLVGDQENNTVLDTWIEQSNGGHFDVIVDDGGHHNCQIYHTFLKFWPLLNPGGLYFIEDLQAGRWGNYMVDVETRCNGTLMVDVIKDWTEQLIDGHVTKYPLPVGTSFILCQHEMCLIAKN